MNRGGFPPGAIRPFPYGDGPAAEEYSVGSNGVKASRRGSSLWILDAARPAVHGRPSQGRSLSERPNRQADVNQRSPPRSPASPPPFGGAVSTAVWAAVSPSTTSAAWACSIIIVGAGRIDLAATRRQPVGQLAQLRLPCDRVGVRRRHLRELAAQQDQPQQVAEDDALLLDQVARADVEVEVAVEAQQLARRPDRLRVDVGDVGMQGVEQQPQLVGQRRRIFFLLFVVFFLVLASSARGRGSGRGGSGRRRAASSPAAPAAVRPAAARADSAAAAAAFPARSPAPGGARCGRRCRVGR